MLVILRGDGIATNVRKYCNNECYEQQNCIITNVTNSCKTDDGGGITLNITSGGGGDYDDS